jgi:hypothetical protein
MLQGERLPIGESMPLHERSSGRVVVQLMMVGVKKSKPMARVAEISNFNGGCEPGMHVLKRGSA